MLTLEGGTHYVVLFRDSASPSGHRVALFRRFRDALAAWQAGARVSPLYALNGSDLPSAEAAAGSLRVLFAGPVRPGQLEELPSQHAFLSLGLFNLVVVSLTDDEATRAREVAAAAMAMPCWEEWTLKDGQVTAVATSPRLEPAEIPSSFLQTHEDDSIPLRAPAREYALLLASTFARAQAFYPPIAKVLYRFDPLFRELLADSDDLGRERLLVLANAALSRQSSQTFAGTTPIFETECHYWSHSLLGIGIASAALLNLYLFVERVLATSNIPERLVKLAEASPADSELLALPSNSAFWSGPHWPSDIANTVRAGDDIVPQITCFSARDGFRSTRVSLSAPLEVLSSCNTVSWTLRTVTHELSHLIIDGCIGALLPTPKELSRIERLSRLMTQVEEPASLLDQLSAYTLFGFWSQAGQKKESRAIEDVLLRHKHSAAELMTHAFDFLYFYESDASVYLESVWASWGVIPNIEHRVREYVLNTIGAIYCAILDRRDGEAIAIEQGQRLLEQIQLKFGASSYITRARSILDSEKSWVCNQLIYRKPLLRVVRYFLFATDVSRDLSIEPLLGAGGRGGYAIEPLTFPYQAISNPLAFSNVFSRDQGPSHLRSVWLLQQLAFVAPPAPRTP